MDYFQEQDTFECFTISEFSPIFPVSNLSKYKSSRTILQVYKKKVLLLFYHIVYIRSLKQKEQV